jgi:hypothetical protein
MSQEEIKQRIKYLVEHGGLYDDPLEDVRRTARWALWLAGTVAILSLVELAVVTLR